MLVIVVADKISKGLASKQFILGLKLFILDDFKQTIYFPAKQNKLFIFLKMENILFYLENFLAAPPLPRYKMVCPVCAFLHS